MIWTTIYNCFFASRQNVTTIGPLQVFKIQTTSPIAAKCQATRPGFLSAQVQPL